MSDDQPVAVAFRIRRHYFEILARRAQRRARSVEAEASSLLEAACRALMGDEATFDERVRAGARLFSQAEVNKLLEDRLRRARESWERSQGARTFLPSAESSTGSSSSLSVGGSAVGGNEQQRTSNT